MRDGSSCCNPKEAGSVDDAPAWNIEPTESRRGSFTDSRLESLEDHSALVLGLQIHYANSIQDE